MAANSVSDGDETILTVKEAKNGSVHHIFLKQFLLGDKEKLEELTCPICKELLTEPVMLNNDSKTPCHHTFCRNCVEKALVNKSECPSCKKSTHDYQVIPASAIQRRLTNLVVACPNLDKGCSSRVSLGIGAKDYLAHLTTCLHRGAECKRCGQLASDWSLDAEIEHNKVCKEITVTCHHCVMTMLRRSLANHQLECDEYPVDCEFKTLSSAPLACKSPMKRKDYHRHCSEQMPLHIAALDKERKKSETELNTTKRKLEATEEEVKNLNVTLKNARMRLTEEEKRRTNYSNQSRWRIPDWKTKRKFRSPKLLAGGVLWEASIVKETAECDCEHEGHRNLEFASILLRPQIPVMVDHSMNVLFVGKYGQTISWDEDCDDDDNDESGCIFMGKICCNELDSLAGEDGIIDMVLLFDLL